MDKNVKALTQEELEQIGGGLVVEDQKQNKYWVIRPDGTAIPAPTREKAFEYAGQYKVNTNIMSAEEFKENFGRSID